MNLEVVCLAVFRVNDYVADSDICKTSFSTQFIESSRFGAGEMICRMILRRHRRSHNAVFKNYIANLKRLK